MVSIGAGETVEIALPSYGALLVRGVDAQGKPLFAKGIYLYPAGGGDIVSSGMVNERLDVPAGTYDVDVDLEPDIWHRGVEIAPGATVEIELPQWGELEVRVTDPAGAGVNRLVYLYLSRDDAKSVVAFTDRVRLVPPGSYVLRLGSNRCIQRCLAGRAGDDRGGPDGRTRVDADGRVGATEPAALSASRVSARWRAACPSRTTCTPDAVHAWSTLSDGADL